MRVGVITLAGAALVSTALGAAGALWAARQPHPHPRSFHDLVHQSLGLTAEEEAKLAPLEARYIEDVRALETRLSAANARLAVAITEGDPASPALAAAEADTKAILMALQDLSIDHVVSMRAAIAPAHRPAFDKAVAASLNPPR